jgi:hypothetical protein
VANVVVLLVLAFLIGCALSVVHRRRRSFVPQRGTSVGADLGAMSDKPRVQVRDVTTTGPNRVRLVLVPEAPPIDSPGLMASSDLDMIVTLRDGELDLLQEWQRSATSLAIVIPPNSRLVRLRSIEDLQPLTLRRVDDE